MRARGFGEAFVVKLSSCLSLKQCFLTSRPAWFWLSWWCFYLSRWKDNQCIWTLTVSLITISSFPKVNLDSLYRKHSWVVPGLDWKLPEQHSKLAWKCPERDPNLAWKCLEPDPVFGRLWSSYHQELDSFGTWDQVILIVFESLWFVLRRLKLVWQLNPFITLVPILINVYE